MTVTSTNYKDQYVGDDLTSDFAYSFYIETQDEIRVDLYDTDGIPTTLAPDQGTGDSYTVAGAGSPSGWEISLTYNGSPRVLATNEALVLYLKPALKQLVSFNSGGKFKGIRHEYLVYDYLTRMILGQQEEIDRCSLDLLDALLDIDVSSDTTLGGDDASDEVMPSQSAVNGYLEIDDDNTLGGSSPSDAVLPSQSAAYEYLTAKIVNSVGSDTDTASSQAAVVNIAGVYTYRVDGFGQQNTEQVGESIPQSEWTGVQKIYRIEFPLPENEFTAAPVFAWVRGLRNAINADMLSCIYYPALSDSTKVVMDLFFDKNADFWNLWGSTLFHLLTRTTP